MRESRTIVVQLALQMNRRWRLTLWLPQGKKGRRCNGERKNKEDGAALKKRALRGAVR